MALRSMPVEEWMERVGRPTLVEIIGDTNVYYYNYRPTLYAVAIYDSTTFFKTWGSASELKPSSANATEVWGSRKDIMQIRVVNELVISAIITEGPDKKVLVRDLNGNIVLDPNSGYNPNVSDEQKVNSSSKDFSKMFSSLYGIAQPVDSTFVETEEVAKTEEAAATEPTEATVPANAETTATGAETPPPAEPTKGGS